MNSTTSNHSGGIWLLWNTENVEVNVIAKETRALHCTVHEKSTWKQCLLSAIYAPAQHHERMPFGSISSTLNDVIDLPWCIIYSEFNEILHSSDKIGGTQLSVSRTWRLSDFLAYSKGIDADADVDGGIFT